MSYEHALEILDAALKWAAIVFGAVVVTMAATLALYFGTSKRGLAVAMAWMVAAECYAAATTLAFAIIAILDDEPGIVASLMRLTIFLAAGLSTVHLAYHIRRVVNLRYHEN